MRWDEIRWRDATRSDRVMLIVSEQYRMAQNWMREHGIHPRAPNAPSVVVSHEGVDRMRGRRFDSDAEMIVLGRPSDRLIEAAERQFAMAKIGARR